MKNLILAGLVLVSVGCSDTSTNGSESDKSLIDRGADAIKDGVDSLVDNKDVIKEKIDEIAKSSSEAVDKVVEKSSAVVDSVKSELVIDAKSIYNTCASCHGANGEKKALNVSNILQGQSRDEIITKLNGYKDGTYGGNMKGVMSAQAKKLSEGKIEAVAEYISKL